MTRKPETITAAFLEPEEALRVSGTSRSGRSTVVDDDLDAVLRLRVVVGRLSRGLRRTKAGAALTATETTVLATVARLGPIGLGELAAEEGLNPTMLSRVLKRLEDSRLVLRRNDPIDRRALSVEVTSGGKRLHERIRTEKTDRLVHLLETFDPAQRRLLCDALPVLETIAEGLKGRPS